MLASGCCLILSALLQSSALGLATFADQSTDGNVTFQSPKYGLTCPLPESWELLVREQDDLVFVAQIPQEDPERPGAVGVELGVAPESLEEYRTRIDSNAGRGRIRGTLIQNEIIQRDDAERLLTITESRPPFGGLWREITVREIVDRQLYVFRISVDSKDPNYEQTKESFDSMIKGARFQPPNTGARLQDGDQNRWSQEEFRFAMNLPDDWTPALAPSQIALLFANGPPDGIWSDNLLVIARPRSTFDADQLASRLPTLLRQEEPNAEVLRCHVIEQPNLGPAVETVARTERGPFSMTVLERRFRGDRYEYEIKFTVETKRFDDLAPALRTCLDSFAELEGE